MTAPLGALPAALALLASTGTGRTLAAAGPEGATNPQPLLGRELDLAALLRVCADESGVAFVPAAPTAARLCRTPVLLPARLARAALVDLAALQLFANDLTCTEVGPAGPSIRVVHAAPPPLPRCLDDAWLRGRLHARLHPDALAPTHR